MELEHGELTDSLFSWFPGFLIITHHSMVDGAVARQRMESPSGSLSIGTLQTQKKLRTWTQAAEIVKEIVPLNLAIPAQIDKIGISALLIAVKRTLE